MNIKQIFCNIKSKFRGKISSNKSKVPALMLSLTMIGTAAVFVMTYYVISAQHQQNKAHFNVPDSKNVSAHPAVSVNSKSSSITTTHPNYIKVSPSLKMTPSFSEHTSKEKSSHAHIHKPQSINFSMPVVGEKIKNFSVDKLIYFKTLNEWRVHSGIDYAADINTSVKCIGPGIVTDIKHDPRYGTMVIIEHANGLKSVYANLAKDITLSPNKRVQQKEIIGKVGNTAGFEIADPPHLHFEVLDHKDNPINPDTIFTKQS